MHTDNRRKLFVTSSGGDKISVFNANDSGNATPIRSIASNAGLFRPQGIFVDVENNEIFVPNLNNTITVHRRTDEADAYPSRTIGGDNTGLFLPVGIFIDTENNEIFVANLNDTITVYGTTGEGNVSPLRTLTGDNTGLSFPKGIFIDIKNSEMFVVNPFINTVTVYEKTANGNVHPLRTLCLLEPEPKENRVSTAIFVDSDNDQLFVVDSTLITLELPAQSHTPAQLVIKSTIKVYPRTAEGNASPSRTIEGESTGLFNPAGIFVDNHEIFVVNSGNNTVTVHERAADGNIPPKRTLSVFDANNSGFRKDQERSSGIFVDKRNSEIVVANLNDTITVYEKAAEGKVPPLRITGPNTALLDPDWIYVDTENKEIFVNNAFSRLITVYGLTDEGNIAPLRTMSHGLLSPQVAFVDKSGHEVFITNLNDSITLHRRTKTPRSRTIIKDENAGLSGPEGIFVDIYDDEIFVANSGNNTITVYEILFKRRAFPLRKIGGSNTGLLYPFGVFVAASQ